MNEELKKLYDEFNENGKVKIPDNIELSIELLDLILDNNLYYQVQEIDNIKYMVKVEGMTVITQKNVINDENGMTVCDDEG